MEMTGLHINVIISIISLLPLAAGVEEPSSVGLHMTCTPTCTLTEWDENSCEPGFSRDCSRESPYSTRKCCLCPAETYMFKDNHCSQCIPYTDCSGRNVKFEGSHTMDRECGDPIDITSTTAEQDWLEGTPPSNTTMLSTLLPSSTSKSTTNSTTIELPQITDTTTKPLRSPPLMDVTTEGAVAGSDHGEVSVTLYMAVILGQLFINIILIVIILMMIFFWGNILGMAEMLRDRMSSFRGHSRSETKDPLPDDAEAGIPLRPPQHPRNEELPERPADNGKDT